MPTARELLAQADALMRRNRAHQIDTEIPELTDVIAMPMTAPAPPARPIALDDIPELTDVVEEIETASIVEVPDDDVEPSDWLHSAHEEPDAHEVARDVEVASPGTPVGAPVGGQVLPLFAFAGLPNANGNASPAATHSQSDAHGLEPAMPESTAVLAPVVELPSPDAGPSGDEAFAPAPDSAPGAEDLPLDAARPVAADDWARWEALAEEIRMQVLQRIDIFTDTGLREHLALQMQPIVERASAEMVATINAQVGQLLRAYIAEAIEREIDKWRNGNR